MKNNRISIRECCAIYEVDPGFMDNLRERGLIHIIEDEQMPAGYILEEELRLLEKYIDFYYDLEINMEGIEAIAHLLNQMQQMKQTILQLQNQLQQHTP